MTTVLDPWVLLAIAVGGIAVIAALTHLLMKAWISHRTQRNVTLQIGTDQFRVTGSDIDDDLIDKVIRALRKSGADAADGEGEQ